MRKYNVIHGAEVWDNKAVMSKLTVQASFMGNVKDSNMEIKKIENLLVEMVDNYMSSVE